MKNFDNSFANENINAIAGIDEAGRGPLAGPVVAASVVFEKKFYLEDINDSKKLTEEKREQIFPIILENCVSFGIGIVDNQEIDKINILNAALKAMKQASESLIIKPDLLLIDGNKIFRSEIRSIPVVAGDSKSFSIAAASILAKVVRDRIMKEFSLKYPHYGWERNKAYATREHIAAIKKFGPCELHRTTFLRKILEVQNEFEFKE